MDKKELSQYRSLVAEIEDAEVELNNLKSRDTVMGSDTNFPFTKHTMTVSGIPSDWKYNNAVTRLNRLKRQRERIEQFVNDIPDNLTLRAVKLRYIDGNKKMSWNKIARKIGGGNTADSIRMLVTRYLKNN